MTTPKKQAPVFKPRPKPPLVLLDGGHETWRILEPELNYDGYIEYAYIKDRRYKEKCVVHGSLREASEVLFELEKARQPPPEEEEVKA